MQLYNLFEFSPKDHIYKLNKKIIPSVTQILWEWQKVGTRYINRYTGASIDADVFEYAGMRGTAVHKAYPLILNKTLDWRSLSDEIIGHCEQFQSWMDEFRPEIRMIERPLYSTLSWFCGTFDIFCRIGSDFYLIDVKTGGINDLQLVAYEYLIQANYPDLYSGKLKKFFLLIKKDSFQFVPMSNPKLKMRDFMAHHSVYMQHQ